MLNVAIPLLMFQKLFFTGPPFDPSYKSKFKKLFRNVCCWLFAYKKIALMVRTTGRRINVDFLVDYWPTTPLNH